MHRLVVLLTVVAAATARNIDMRILGGKPVKIEEYPFQVSLQSLEDHFCGGVIIKPTYILTTANCIYGRQPNTYQVRYGTARRKEGGTLKDVQDYRTHPVFRTARCEFDVGIITLKTPIVFSATASPVTLVPLDQKPRDGAMLVATGWGYTKYKPVLSDQLQAVQIPLIDYKRCVNTYIYYPAKQDEYLAKVTENMLCAGGGVNAGPFLGDIGGPLLNDKKQLVGLTSWGFAWGNVTGHPAVFTNMTSRSVRLFISKRTK